MTNKPASPEDEKDMFAENTDETAAGAPLASPSPETPEDSVEVERVESGEEMADEAGETVEEDAGGMSDDVVEDDFDADFEDELNIEGLEDLVNEGLIQTSEEEGDAPAKPERETISATPAAFPELKEDGAKEAKNNIAMLLDISLPIVVELGRTRMYIEDVLKLHVGSVISLDKVAGEPANIVVNDKVMAKGEVVVIDENFGIRITSLLNPVDRLQGLK